MPRCKNCEEKFEPIHFNAKYCFKPECKKVWIESEKVKQWSKDKPKRKANLETVQKLMKKVQKVFNTFIRTRDKEQNCISCDRKLEGKFDAGHYFSSERHKNITFNEDNVHGQCVYCNQHKRGNLIAYQIGIEKRIGGVRLLKLHEQAHKKYKPTRDELKELIIIYTKKIKEL